MILQDPPSLAEVSPNTCTSWGLSADSNGVAVSHSAPQQPEANCNSFTLLSRFSLITIELEPDVLINGVLNDSCDHL